jgi:hypothetical protein
MYYQKLITDYYRTNGPSWQILRYMKKKIKFMVTYYGLHSIQKNITRPQIQSLLTDYYPTLLNIKPAVIQKTIKDYYK